jgi:DNA-binding MarR family transcriptional regulator/predicted GNAT family N-acyltransferase
MINNFLFGLKLKKMGEELLSQTTQILADSGYNFDKRTIPVLFTLLEKRNVNVNELANILGMTHPAIVQVAGKLNTKGLISIKKSDKDKRITILEITKNGEAVCNQIQPVINEIQNCISMVMKSIDGNLSYSFMKLEKAIRSREIIKNVKSLLSQNAMKEIVIVPYNKKYRKDFSRLNYEWMKKYFEIEEEDKWLLKNPEKEIIKKGGEIFFALMQSEIVGTCAVVKKDSCTYELTKMAVTEKAQGKQVGKKLALTSIGYVVEQGGKKLILSTSDKLVAALNLYKSLGFNEVKKTVDGRNKRELIHMELDLTD